MVLTKVPIVPQWNLTSGCVCTPNGGLMYVGARCINYIGSVKDLAAAAPIMKTFHTRQNILGVDIDPGWSGTEGLGNENFFAVLAQDSSIQIWDFNKERAVSGHRAHFNPSHFKDGNNGNTSQGERVLFSYMRNRNILSVDAQDLVVYCVASNTYCRRPTFVSTRNQQLTVLRCSPYNEHMFAIGTSRGLVVIGDLQRMSIMYTLRGHDSAITTLSWRPREKPVIFTTKQTIKYKTPAVPLAVPSTAKPAVASITSPTAASTVAPTVVATTSVPAVSTTPAPAVAFPPISVAAKSAVGEFGAGGDDMFDIYDYDYLENEFGAPPKEVRTNSEESEFVGIEKPKELATTTQFDFAEACQSLKEEIDSLKQECVLPPQCDAVTLADCQEAAQTNIVSIPHSSDGEDESTEGSLELVARSSSDEDVPIDGTERKVKQQILHQAEVHATQTDLESEKKNVLPEDAPTSGNANNCDTEVVTQSAGDGGATDLPMHVLLASASIDGTFWIWNTETGASCDSVKTYGNNSCANGKQGKMRNTNIGIAWLNATQFLTTNKQGDLSFWSLIPQTDKYRYKFKEVKYNFKHKSVVAFAIARKEASLWCISSYREISCENIAADQLIAKYCCASTNISAMRECPDDMNKIALGFSDRRIGIIDISKMSTTSVVIENFTLRIDSPVLSMVWSPDNTKLAYGTIEGRVGIVNVENSKQHPFTFNPVCGKPIYSIDWQGNNIYCACNDMLAVYNDNMQIKDAHVITAIQGVSCISVRGEVLFVGTKYGFLKVYRCKLDSCYELLQDIQLAPRYITEIAWSPIAAERFAVVANANNIHVLNYNAEEGKVTIMRKIEIKDLRAANAYVKWSNRNQNEFLTCGFDGAVRAWDLGNGAANEEKFLKQFHCPMTCGLFLPTDENIVMCAGKSTSVELFDMRVENSSDYAPTAKWKRSTTNTLDNVVWALKVSARPDAKNSTATEKRRSKRAGNNAGVATDDEVVAEVAVNGSDVVSTAPNGNAQRNVIMPVSEAGNDNIRLAEMISTITIDDSIQSQEKTEIPVKAEKIGKSESVSASVFMKNAVTLLYLTTKEINRDMLVHINSMLHSLNLKKGDNKLLCAKLFGTKNDAKKLLAEELDNYKHSETKGISHLFMQLANSDMKQEILRCVQNKQLTEWHLSMAPSISYQFWGKCCQAFAEQLLDQGLALQAASYMLAIHNHPEAINMLVKKNYFKEALLVGRIFLQNDDPRLAEISHSWITYLCHTGNLAGAAQLCILSEQWNLAHEILSKVRSTEPELQRVLEILKTKEQTNN